MEQSEQQLLRYAVDVVTAHVGNNPVAVSDVPAFLREVYTALQELDGQRRQKHRVLSPQFQSSRQSSVTILSAWKMVKNCGC